MPTDLAVAQAHCIQKGGQRDGLVTDTTRIYIPTTTSTRILFLLRLCFPTRYQRIGRTDSPFYPRSRITRGQYLISDRTCPARQREKQEAEEKERCSSLGLSLLSSWIGSKTTSSFRLERTATFLLIVFHPISSLSSATAPIRLLSFLAQNLGSQGPTKTGRSAWPGSLGVMFGRFVDR